MTDRAQTIPLSPASQAVLDAVVARLDLDAHYHSHEAAAAALADEPAVPQGREPASVVAEPSDGEVDELTGQLIEAANGAAAMGWDQHARSILRAAELLQRPMADLSPAAYALLTLAAELES